MADSRDEGKFSRRAFLGSGALAAGVGAAAGRGAQSPEKTYGTAPGPKNPQLDSQNSDSDDPPSTDAGAVATFKYPFAFGHRQIHQGGWSREVTVRELPISKSMAGVNMRLTPGGVRELHWHAAAEWAYMLYGSARITALDGEGKGFVADVHESDLWYFPTGIPHSIQGLNPDGAEFLLVFDDGNFSEYDTVLLSDWTAHTPRDVLAKNLGVSEESLHNLPAKQLYIFQSQVPGPLEEDQKAAAGTMGLSSSDFAFRTRQLPVTKRTRGGEVRIVDSSAFQVSKTIAAAIVTVHPGGLRELHWHPNADEWQYYLAGQARMTVFATGGRARTMDFAAGDVGYIQQTLPHYIQNAGNTDLVFLEMFKSSLYQDLALSEWLTHTPPELVRAHLNISRAALEAIPRVESVVLPE